MSLWDNIRKRRAAGKRKLKPGDKNYPKTLNIEAARPQVRWKKAGPNGEIEATIGGKKYKIEKSLDHNERHKGEWKVYVWDKRDWEWETTEYGKANAKAWIMDRMNESTDWVCGKCNCEPCTCGEINEEAPAGANTASIPNPADTAMGPRFKPKNVTDRRRKKEMVLLKRFRKHMEENG
jgi:hypothetical protein